MRSDIISSQMTCEACIRHTPSKTPGAPLPKEMAQGPMEVMAADLFELNQKHYLVLVDRFSGYPLHKQLRSLSTKAITTQLYNWFLTLGFPRVIRSDNGPQFRTEFADFCETHAILHETSSPYNPRSNGLAEAAVKNVKTVIRKAKELGEDPETALAIWRATPRTGSDLSPSELFFQRKLALPSLPDTKTWQQVPISEEMKKNDTKIEERQALFEQRPILFAPGQSVKVQDPISKEWTQGKIIEPRPGNLSYKILIGDKEALRNHRFIRAHPQ